MREADRKHIASREEIIESNALALIWRDVREAAAKPRLVIDDGASMREVLIANMATALKDVLVIDQGAAPKVLASDNEAMR